MSAVPSPTQSEPSVDSLPALFEIPAEAPAIRPADLKNDTYPNGRSSFGKRAFIAAARFLIIFCIGVSATLAWQSYGDRAREMIASQSYGDAAREMIASLYSRLSWLAPQAEPVAQNTPDVIGLASPTASSHDQQQPNAKLLDVEALRRSIDRIATSIVSSQEQMTSSADRIATSQDQIARSVDRMATSQEQIARGVDRLTADQEQLTREITKLQEIEQSIRSKNSEPSQRPASAPKPVSRPASAPTAKPVSRASPEPTGP
jgi:hypothetical protein